MSKSTLSEQFFAAKGFAAFPFQRQVWRAMALSRSGLLHATTGSGKTFAVWLGALNLLSRELAAATARQPAPLSVLWITPMRALAADTAKALAEPLAALGAHASIGLRTGDTPAAERARQDRRMPFALVTTPESLTLLLTREKARAELSNVQVVIVDEWHELIASKRGVQTQLALARLRRFRAALSAKPLSVWGLSATLGNSKDAMDTLCGPHALLVEGKQVKALRVDTLIPPEVGRFPWGGHLGIQMLVPVAEEIERSQSTLVFTNTRSQAELWYQQLLGLKPEWAGQIALHHGSLDKAVREWVEAELKAGRLKAVVATSSLDLGVDFSPVERVLQIGSAKGVGRLLQRAGRSGHSPGRESRITLVPTHALELVEAVAARRAAQAGRVESRRAPDKPMDVLVQHLVSMALGEGFTPDALFAEVRSAPSYRELSAQEFAWALLFVERGGQSLTAYPDYHRVKPDENGVYRVSDSGIARRHRLGVGTIVSDASMKVQYLGGASIGTIEESFVSRLRKGDCFLFGGRMLEYLRTQDMTAYVRRATKKRGAIPRWGGGKMPLSSEMAQALEQVLQSAAQGDLFDAELQAARGVLQAQASISQIPQPHMLLVEHWTSREGTHFYIYPFAGRNVHLGLASLFAYRLARDASNTFSISVNDYGFELQSVENITLDKAKFAELLSDENLLADVLASLNSGELAQRRFREIARVAGLIQSGYPGAPRSAKQLQASSSLFFEVFKKYDAQNHLLLQSSQEVLAQELEISRLRECLAALDKRELTMQTLKTPSPFCFPLLVERLRETLSTEKLSSRLERLLKDMEAEADARPRVVSTFGRNRP